MTQSGGVVGETALARCIACDPAAFAAQYWGRQPLLTRASELGGEFTDLLDAAAVDELVARRGLRTPFLRMARDGSVLAPASFTRGGGAGASVGDQAADDKILGAGRRRRDPRPAGAAPHLATPDRLHRSAVRRARPSGPGQRLRHPVRQPGVRAALRRPRRLRAAGRRAQALADPRAGARRPVARSAVGAAARGGRQREPDRRRSSTPSLRPATRSTCRAARSTRPRRSANCRST